jgi:drug/metabolite transporter (DMT)-like permease
MIGVCGRRGSLPAVASHASIPATVLGVVLFAAVLHASWNAIAHRITDLLVGFALMGVAVSAVSVAVIVTSPLPARASWPFLGVSAVLQVTYELLLMRCYRLGDFGQMYPISRGTSPWLVAIAATLFAGEDLAPVQLLGVAVISVGLVCLVFAGGVPDRTQLAAVTAALLTGVTIAAYTTVDGIGVRHAGTTAGYTGWLFLLQGLALPLIALALRGRRLWSQVKPHLATGLTAGVLSLAAYGLVLWAQTRAALALVAALRETSIVAGALIAAALFREPLGRWRIIAATLVAAGTILIAT